MTQPQTAGTTADGAPPGTPSNPLLITDPRAMRALAHPARIAILQHLALDGPATATECAEVAGLSPSACSYHLRALARYGFVRADPDSAADGRHRPWRATVVAISFGEDADQPEAARAAGRLLSESLLARVAEIRAAYAAREADYPPQWRAAAGTSQDVLHVTAAELKAIRGQLTELLTRYRRLDPAGQPAAAHRVHVLLEMIPWFDPADAEPAS